MLPSPIVELRQYTLHPGRRGVLIELFEAELVETQEAVGMKVIGTFRDVDDPDRFVWLRGFETMDSRARALGEFYEGPVWRRHRDAANATMVDSDNVLLLRPATSGGGFALPAEPPAAREAADPGRGIVEALVLGLRAPLREEVAARLSAEIAARVTTRGGTPLAFFVTEESENTYPALPVREGEQVFVAFSGYPAHAGSATLSDWRDAAEIAGADIEVDPVAMRLVPTRRSRLDGLAARKGTEPT